MNITNRWNLPAPVYNAISKDNYVRGDNNYSVTELIEAPRVVQLKRRHWDDITEDAIDRVWSIFGSAVHHIMETHTSDEAFVEQRYYLSRLDRKVGGMVDCYNNGTISDYKVTSAWSIVYGSKTEHWEQQLNLYAHILRENGIEVNKLHIVAFLRDWDKKKARQDSSYPQIPLMVIPLRVWSTEECEKYMLDRLNLHIFNETQEEPTQCQPDECWERPSMWAIMKEGRKTAVRVFEDYAEALDFKHTKLPVKEEHLYTLVERKGGRIRCSEYCPAAQFCSQWQEYNNG